VSYIIFTVIVCGLHTRVAYDRLNALVDYDTEQIITVRDAGGRGNTSIIILCYVIMQNNATFCCS